MGCSNSTNTQSYYVEQKNYEEICLEIHNKKRDIHGSPLLEINEQLCDLAKKCAVKLSKNEDKINYIYKDVFLGQNIYIYKGNNFRIRNIFNEWYKEINNYNFEQPGFTIDSSHFTQIVWKETTKVGCGAALKDDDEKTYKVVCYYYKAGNILNPEKFKANVIEHSYNQIIIMNYFSLILILFYLF